VDEAITQDRQVAERIKTRRTQFAAQMAAVSKVEQEAALLDADVTRLRAEGR